MYVIKGYSYTPSNNSSKLVRAGADVNATDNTGRNALHYTLGYGNQETARFLIKKGADYNHPDNRGVTPAQPYYHLYLSCLHPHLFPGTKAAGQYLY